MADSTEKMMVCPTCKGTGDSNGNHERDWHKCRTCDGVGEIPKNKRSIFFDLPSERFLTEGEIEKK
jgi:DnaJ-class molecular chaperone